MASNYPPGVTESMIEGDEGLAVAFLGTLENKEADLFSKLLFSQNLSIQDLINKAIDWAFEAGVSHARAIQIENLQHPTTGLDFITVERKRQQQVEGWTTERDMAIHTKGELALAAVCYSFPKIAPVYWPWSWSWWKPTPCDRIRELSKAGALIAAEIDRLQLKGETNES